MHFPSWLARVLVRSGVARLLPNVQRRLAGGADFLRYYSDRLLDSPLHDLERIASAVQQAPPDVIDLSCGSPRFDLLPSATTRLPADRRGWPCPNGLPELRGAIAAQLLQDNHLALSPAEEILITPGALGAVQVILDAFVNRGDAVALTDPVSPLYPLLVRTRAASVRWIGASCEDGRLSLRFDHLARKLRGCRLLVVNSPHNPTGGLIAAEDLERLVWWCRRFDVLILADETLERFTYDEPAPSIATFADARSRTLIVNSVSKSHALAWARVGWIAAHRHLLRPCLATAALRCPFVPTLEQQIALAALQTPDSALSAITEQYGVRRRQVFERLGHVGLKAPWPGGGFFFWVQVPAGGKDGRAFSDALLSERRVKLTPGDLFGPSGRSFVRLSYAVEEGRLEEGLNRLAEALAPGTRAARAA